MMIITLINIGFSIIGAAILLITYALFLDKINKTWLSVTSCACLLVSIICLQVGHINFLLNGTDALLNGYYRFFLFIAPSMFFFFSRATLLPGASPSPLLLLHLIPPILLYLFVKSEISITLVFLTGMAYSFWLANLIYSLKAQRKRFHIEMFFFGLFAITALCVLIIGISIPYIDNTYFYYFYSNCIAMAFILIIAALIVFPEMLDDLAEVAKLNYAASTLNDVDVDKCREKLEQLITKDKMHQNENLNLSMVAKAMELTGHQLSELINSQFGMNFSKYIREHRINIAKALLENEPNSSVLAISLETGFKSQSNFYAAFKEITGMPPGSYRKRLQKHS